MFANLFKIPVSYLIRLPPAVLSEEYAEDMATLSAWDDGTEDITRRVETSLRISSSLARNSRVPQKSTKPLCVERSTLRLKDVDDEAARKQEWRKLHPLPPSAIEDDDFCWVYSPQYSPQSTDDEEKGGKWMLFLNKVDKDEFGYTDLDYSWFRIEELVHLGNFWMAKASTASDKDIANSKRSKRLGVIMIYTIDAEDVNDVIEKGKFIYENFELLNPMYYKTIKASNQGLYRCRGNKNISLYRCLQDGTFEKRVDEDGSWGPI